MMINNRNLKIHIKKFTKNFSRKYYKFAPNKIKKIIHYFTTYESLNENTEKYLPDTIFFELRTRCNGQCSFCAASIQNETRPDLLMDFELFKKVIKELSNLKFKGRIAFHVNSEPLLIKNIEEFIGFARTNLKDAWIQILSNGKSLNPINGKKIIDAGINELSLNIYNDNLEAELPKNIKNFEEQVLYKLFNKEQIYSGHTNKKPGGKSLNYNIFKRLLNEVLTSRAGTSPNKKSNRDISKDYGFCGRPFEQFNITANGNVSQCCCDLTFSNSMGNIKFESLKKIWDGEKFTKLRKDLVNGNRKNNELCKKCDFFGLNKAPKSWFRKFFYFLLKHN